MHKAYYKEQHDYTDKSAPAHKYMAHILTGRADYYAEDAFCKLYQLVLEAQTVLAA